MNIIHIICGTNKRNKKSCYNKVVYIVKLPSTTNVINRFDHDKNMLIKTMITFFLSWP